MLGSNTQLSENVWFRQSDAQAATAGTNVPASNQTGIRGGLSFQKHAWCPEDDDVAGYYQVIAVWEDDKKTVIQPGIYAAVAQCMEGHNNENPPYPSIFLMWAWNDDESKWEEWVPRLKGDPGRSDDIFLHPRFHPTKFQGCLGPGPDWAETDWGFTDDDVWIKAVWEMLEAVGVSRDNWNGAGGDGDAQKDTAKWFLGVIEDPDGVAAGNTEVVERTVDANCICDR